jgi:hypothetical protein
MLIITCPVKKSLFMETKRFTRDCHWSILSQANLVHIFLFMHPSGLASGLFPSSFHTKTLDAFISFPVHATFLDHFIFLDLINPNNIW